MMDQKRIVLLGTHGQYNIGDELLLETFLRQLGAEHHYVVNTYDAEFTAQRLAGRFDVEMVDTRRGRWALLGHLRRCDAVCFAGGSIIKELYASTGRNKFSTLLMILATVTFANVVARKPIAMLNIGVGPITTRRGRWLAGAILRQVDLLTVRDRRSYDTCLAAGVAAADVEQTVDAVFGVDAVTLLGREPEPCSEGLGGRELEGGRRIRVALNLNFDIENPANWDHFLNRLADALIDVDYSHPIEVHTLAMQTGFKDHDDAEVLASFAARLDGIPVHHHLPVDHHDVAAIVDGCDVVVAERLHAIVISAILATPVFVLAYDVKVRELVVLLGLDDVSVDINTGFETSAVSEPLRRLIDVAAERSADLADRCSEVRQVALAGAMSARSWLDGC